MSRKRHRPEEIIAKARETDAPCGSRGKALIYLLVHLPRPVRPRG